MLKEQMILLQLLLPCLLALLNTYYYYQRYDWVTGHLIYQSIEQSLNTQNLQYMKKSHRRHPIN